MKYHRREWCLYLKGIINNKGVDLTKYDGYIGRETGIETEEYKTLKLTSTLKISLKTLQFHGKSIKIVENGVILH